MKPEEIRALREALDLTQEALAFRVGVDRSAIAQWETGRTKPRGSAQILLRQLEATITVDRQKNFGSQLDK